MIQNSNPFILLFIKRLCMKYVKNYYLSFFFQAGHVIRHVGNLSHGNRLISFSFRDSAWATRTPKDYTNQTESKWKEVAMSWTVSKWIFLWFFFHKRIKIYVKCSLIWMTTFLRFWRKKIIFAMSVTISFWFCHLSYKCWLVQNYVC